MIAVQHNVNFTNMYKSDEYNMRSKKHVILVDKSVLQEFVTAVELDDELMTNRSSLRRWLSGRKRLKPTSATFLGALCRQATTCLTD